jgi:DNA-binding transcriptional regulator YiaG
VIILNSEEKFREEIIELGPNDGTKPWMMVALRLGREQSKLTQAQLAMELGVTGKVVSNWERGEHLPEKGRLPQLERILKIPMGQQ